MKSFFRIESLSRGAWTADNIGDHNEFASRADAYRAIDALRALGGDWETGEYRVTEQIDQSSELVIINGQSVDLDAARNLMDDEICEAIHGSVSTAQEFVDAYLAAHEQKFGAPFVFN
jgi:hypothetical protein